MSKIFVNHNFRFSSHLSIARATEKNQRSRQGELPERMRYR